MFVFVDLLRSILLVKAQKVKGIKCDNSAVVNARKIIAVRLDEMMSFDQYVDQPDNIKQIHDLRIAAKRLRYSLEMFRFAFPKGLNKLIKEVKAIQQSIGDMRDADVMIARVRDLLEENSQAKAARLMDIATATERGTVSQRRHRMKSAISSPALPRDELSFYTLIAFRTDDSIAAYEQFQTDWAEMIETDFAGRLRQFVGIDPVQPGEDPESAAFEAEDSEAVAEVESEITASESSNESAQSEPDVEQDILVEISEDEVQAEAPTGSSELVE